ncbi:MAG: M48 family metallopeptidase [Pirellulales bacterium]|nr:M48 family metallopeptidase [Pirellulales bacterium]
MSTDFFERQDAARRSTAWLAAMFLLGVVAVVGGTMLAAWLAVEGLEGSQAVTAEYDPRVTTDAVMNRLALPLAAGAAALLLITFGSLYKIAQLRGGGHVVAENLGGRRVFPDTTDATERRLLNVVEEMALASGVPTPPVFLLHEEPAINAFAAGSTPSDAVVAVTRGTVEQLSRDELQGVVAHEFSHILNGDMRLNIRLIGVLHGILLLGLLGRILVRLAANSSRGPRRSRDSKKGGDPTAYMFIIGLALVVLGYLGTLIGNLIKAAVSRQREYLADASAVQFTRNPGGLAGALKRIGAAIAGSRLKAPSASEASHLFFAQGVFEGITGLTATHPPLNDRIRRLDPQWDGTFPPPLETPSAVREHGEQAAGLFGGRAEHARAPVAETLPVQRVSKAAEQVGDPREPHRQYAASLIESLPKPVLDSVREPYGARAVVFGLLADRNSEVRLRQLASLERLAAPDVAKLTKKLLPYVDILDVRARLPLIDLAMPALRAMSPSQYRDFLACFQELAAADNRLGLFEWMLYRVLLRHLRPQFEKSAAPRASYHGLQRMGRQCSVLLSTLAHADNRLKDAPAAVARAADKLKGVDVRLLPPEECGLEPLSQALEDLATVVEKQRRPLIEGCAACICADREVTVAEAELLRGVCDMLNCPMPPLLPGGPAVFAHDGAAV